MSEPRTTVAPSTLSLDGPTLNSDVNWDSFDSVDYCDHNYGYVREDDRKIVELVRDFFADAGVEDGRGVDVGPGANLYPSLAMLPFCASLDLREFSASNVTWLEQQKQAYHPNWDRFWEIYQQHPAYARVRSPRSRFRQITSVRRASVFDLPRSSWDLGTMFFVACSLSTEMAEFERAVCQFVQALLPGAPFAAGFMAQSQGYQVGSTWFPAVAIGRAEVEKCVTMVARDVVIEEIDTANPLRDGVGMLLATGRAAG
jgi:hypothetical protein